MSTIPAHLLGECLRVAADGCYELPPENMIELSHEVFEKLQGLMTLNSDSLVVSNLCDELDNSREFD